MANGRGLSVHVHLFFLSSFRSASAAKRWWVVLAWHIINLAVHNAYIVPKLNHAAGTGPMTKNAFRLTLAEQLVNGWTCRKPAGRHSSKPVVDTHQLCAQAGW